jgi:hypothetical protein
MQAYPYMTSLSVYEDWIRPVLGRLVVTEISLYFAVDHHETGLTSERYRQLDETA